MSRDELEIEISPTGKVTVRTIGIHGPRCLEWAEFLAQVIGREESRELTNEYYLTDQHVQQHLEQKQRR